MASASSLPVPHSEFAHLVAAAMQRMLVQTGLSPATPEELARIAEVLAVIGAEAGARWRAQGRGAELPDSLVREWTGRALEAAPGREGEAGFAALVKQLIKGCFQPEPEQCRLSYRELDRMGRCRRQTLDYVRPRLSGAHCVDCPYWTFAPDEHRAWLAGQWHGGAAEFAASAAMFLPEDFRRLRKHFGPERVG